MVPNTLAPFLAGFIANAVNETGSWATQIMNCFSPESVPVITTLASEFALIDSE